MQIGGIRVQRLYLQVAGRLRDMIAGGDFPAGARLPSERDLAAQLGVSRPTVREAIIALEIAGLVAVRTGSGVYVLERKGRPARLPDLQAPGPFEILEARKLIEGEACALAAVRIGKGQLQRLQALLRELAARDDDVDAAERVDEQFHCLIAEAAGNSALAAVITWLWRLRNESEISTRLHRRVREEGSRPIIADHRAIVDALRAGDPDAARAAMTTHLDRVIDGLLEAP